LLTGQANQGHRRFGCSSVLDLKMDLIVIIFLEILGFSGYQGIKLKIMGKWDRAGLFF